MPSRLDKAAECQLRRDPSANQETGLAADRRADVAKGAPSWSILDASHPYVPSHRTDLRKTFKRIRRQQANAKAAESEKRATQRIIAFSKPAKGGA